jgi:hypothetical protein
MGCGSERLLKRLYVDAITDRHFESRYFTLKETAFACEEGLIHTSVILCLRNIELLINIQ